MFKLSEFLLLLIYISTLALSILIYTAIHYANDQKRLPCVRFLCVVYHLLYALIFSFVFTLFLGYRILVAVTPVTGYLEVTPLPVRAPPSVGGEVLTRANEACEYHYVLLLKRNDDRRVSGSGAKFGVVTVGGVSVGGVKEGGATRSYQSNVSASYSAVLVKFEQDYREIVNTRFDVIENEYAKFNMLIYRNEWLELLTDLQNSSVGIFGYIYR